MYDHFTIQVQLPGTLQLKTNYIHHKIPALEKLYTLASKMKLFKGFEEEYKRRHDQLWPELNQLLKASGIKEYHIFLDEDTLTLFAILKTDDPAKLDSLPSHPVMQKWWHYMKDIMDTNEDKSPVNIPLKQVFALQ